jgi:hypothetical protein
MLICVFRQNKHLPGPFELKAFCILQALQLKFFFLRRAATEAIVNNRLIN